MLLLLSIITDFQQTLSNSLNATPIAIGVAFTLCFEQSHNQLNYII